MRTLFKDSDDMIKGEGRGCGGDPRLVSVSDEDFAALGELFDRRGCPRYSWNSETSSCDLIAVESRVVPHDVVFGAWRAWASFKSAKEADGGLSGDLLAQVDVELARLEAAYSEVTRAGNSSDEP